MFRSIKDLIVENLPRCGHRSYGRLLFNELSTSVTNNVHQDKMLTGKFL